MKIIKNYLVTITTEGDVSIWDIQELLDIEKRFSNLYLE